MSPLLPYQISGVCTCVLYYSYRHLAKNACRHMAERLVISASIICCPSCLIYMLIPLASVVGSSMYQCLSSYTSSCYHPPVYFPSLSICPPRPCISVSIDPSVSLSIISTYLLWPQPLPTPSLWAWMPFFCYSFRWIASKWGFRATLQVNLKQNFNDTRVYCSRHLTYSLFMVPTYMTGAATPA